MYVANREMNKAMEVLPFDPNTSLAEFKEKIVVNAGLNSAEFMKNYNTLAHYNIKLKLNDKGWLKLYDSLNKWKFPKEIISYEITDVQPSFINEVRREYIWSGEQFEIVNGKMKDDHFKPLTVESHVNQILFLLPTSGIEEFILRLPAAKFDVEKLDQKRIIKHIIKPVLQKLHFENIDFT